MLLLYGSLLLTTITIVIFKDSPMNYEKYKKELFYLSVIAWFFYFLQHYIFAVSYFQLAMIFKLVFSIQTE